MRFRRLCIPALLVLVLSVFAQAQSLADLARQERARRQRSGEHLKIYTNDDLETPAEKARDEDQVPAEGGEQIFPAKAASQPAASAKADSAKKAKAGENGEQELEKQTAEVNKQYLDRIADLKSKIAKAQDDLAHLERDQAESKSAYVYSSGTSTNAPSFEEQQRTFSDQIEQQRAKLTSLQSDLEDAKEAARHAGVPHAED